MISIANDETEGIPNEERIKIDASTAFNYMCENKKTEIDLNKIYLFGRSLGGTVAIYTTFEMETLQGNYAKKNSRINN